LNSGSGAKGIQKILKEVKKHDAVLLCSNCHREHHFGDDVNLEDYDLEKLTEELTEVFRKFDFPV